MITAIEELEQKLDILKTEKKRIRAKNKYCRNK